MDNVASLLLWERFRTALKEQFGATEHAILADAWSSATKRTFFYATDLLRRISSELDLTLRQERLLVDYALCTREDDIPLIFVESENNASLAEEEIWKLCALASPVRVLLSVAEWDPASQTWPHPGFATERLSKWRGIASAFAREYKSLGGVLAAVIGEWRPDDVFRLYAHRLAGVDWPDGSTDVILEQRMTVRQPIISRGG